MRRTSSLFGIGILPAVLSAAMGDVAHAHVEWFERAAEYEPSRDLFFRPLPVAVRLATLAAGFLLWRKRGRGFVPGRQALGAREEGRSALYGLLPTILGVHAAAPLFFVGAHRGTSSRRTT